MISIKTIIKNVSVISSLIVGLVTANTAMSTVVEVRTVEGNFQVNLFDETTPLTVANFLSYVNSGAYANNTVHRSVPGFVIQMGGFEYANAFPPEGIATGPSVNNEPRLSNLRGTLAMAKLGSDPNSATSQFFVNLSNNSSNLDDQNGGFTVFGQVLGDGMQVVDAIAALQRFNYGGAFTDLPLRNFSAADANAGTVPNDQNLVIITDIVIIDSATVTNPNLNPTPNTIINAPAPSNPNQGDSSGGGGALGLGLLSVLLLITFRRRTHSV